MTESKFAKPWAAVPPLPRKSITEQSVNLQDGERTTRVSTTGGPPLKMFVVEMSERYDHDAFAQFADNTVKALWLIMQTHPSNP